MKPKIPLVTDAVYEETDGQTTRRLVERQEDFESKHTIVQRTYRTGVWLSLLVFLWVLWRLFSFGSEMHTTTQFYDPTRGVQLHVGGCDVDFAPGREPTIAYTTMPSASHAKWRKRDSDAHITEFAELTNKRGCGKLRPGVGCRRVCLIVVSVPPAASTSATFRVEQDADDLEAPTVTVSPNTTLHTLEIAPRQAPRALMVRMKGATITSGFTAKLGFGGMRAIDSALPASSTVEAVFSIYLFGVTVAGSARESMIPSGGVCAVGNDAAGSDFATASRSSLGGVFGGLVSTAGEVVMTPHANYDGGANVAAAVPQPQLAFSDAQRIQQTYSSSFGDRHSTGTAYIIFDVSGSDSVPNARFVYTTNPFFLYLSPSTLQFLTAGVLVPTVYQEDLHFTGFDCSLPEGDVMSPAMRNATLAAMASQITKYLHSDPDDDDPLRGVILFTAEQGLEQPPFWGQPELLRFPVHGVGLTKPMPWTNEHIATMLTLSLYLVLAVGLLFGGITTYAAYAYFKNLSEQVWMLEEANLKLVFAKRYGPDGDSRYLAKRETEGSERARPLSNPFTEPFSLITKLTITPLRKKTIDSLAGFIDRSMQSVPHVTVHPRHAPPQHASQQPEDDVLRRPSTYLWMRDVLRQYEIYCYENTLSIEPSKYTIQRRLLAEYGATIKMLTVNRLYGIRWKTSHEHRMAYVQSEVVRLIGMQPSPANESEADLKRRAAEAVVRTFIATNCTLDDEQEWIDLETRDGCDGKPDVGFKPALERWAKKHELAVPKLELGNSMWCKRALPPTVTAKLGMQEKQLRGLQYVRDKSDLKIPWSWYGIEAVTVLAHSCLYIPQLLMMGYTISAQNHYSLYVCPPERHHSGLHPLTWLDLFTMGFGEIAAERQTALCTRLVVGGTVFFTLCTLLRQALSYMDIRRPQPTPTGRKMPLPAQLLSVLATLEELYKHFYSVLVVFQIFLFTSFVGVVACWFLLATALDPTAFLPYGVAAVTVVTVAITMMNDLIAAATRIRSMLEAAFNRMVADRIAEASKKRDESLRARLSLGDTEEPPAPSGVKVESEIEGEGAGEGEGEAEGEHMMGSAGQVPPHVVLPDELFSMIDDEGDGVLSKEEFAKLFKLLDVKLSESKQEKLFALCDVDCNGMISREEFVNGWNLMVQSFTADGAEAVGLGQTQILITIAYVIVTMGLAIGFILVTLAAWANDDNFGAVVQSVLIAGAGKTSSSARSKLDAEDPSKSKELTEELMTREAES